MPRTTWSAFLLAGLTTACGARSALEVGGTGGAAGTGGTTGSPPVACALAMPIAALEDPGGDDGQPDLVTLYSPPKSNALVYPRQALPKTTDPQAQLTVFTGWGPWPPPELAAGTTAPLIPWSGPAAPMLAASILVAAPRPPQAWAFDALIGSGDPVQSTFVESVFLGGSNPASFALSGTPVMVEATGDAGAAIAGVSSPVGSRFMLAVGVLKPVQGFVQRTAGCATTPVAAGAAAGPGGWLLATALGAPLALELGEQQDLCTHAGIGPATSLQFTTLDWNANPGPISPPISASAPVSRVRVAPRSDGAWAIWSEQGQPGLSGVLLDAGASPTSPFHTFTQTSGLVDGAFDVQPLADVLAIAAVARVSGQNDVVAVELLGEAHQVLWSTTVPTGGQVDGAPRLLAAPGDDALLLTWSELAQGAAGRRLRVAKIDCAGVP